LFLATCARLSWLPVHSASDSTVAGSPTLVTWWLFCPFCQWASPYCLENHAISPESSENLGPISRLWFWLGSNITSSRQGTKLHLILTCLHGPPACQVLLKFSCNYWKYRTKGQTSGVQVGSDTHFGLLTGCYSVVNGFLACQILLLELYIPLIYKKTKSTISSIVRSYPIRHKTCVVTQWLVLSVVVRRNTKSATVLTWCRHWSHLPAEDLRHSLADVTVLSPMSWLCFVTFVHSSGCSAVAIHCHSFSDGKNWTLKNSRFISRSSFSINLFIVIAKLHK